MSFLTPLLTIALAWIVPATLSVVGATLAWRAVRMLARRRRGRCVRCGQRLQGGEWRTDVCPECGVERAAPIRLRCAAFIAIGLVLQAPLVVQALPIPGRETLLFIAALGVVGCAYLLDLALLRRRIASRSARRARLALVAAALVLQLPWMLVAYRFLRAAYIEHLVASCNLPGLGARLNFDGRPSASPLFAWMPTEWQLRTSQRGMFIIVSDARGWSSLRDAPHASVVSIGTDSLLTRPPDHAEFAYIARCAGLEDLSFAGDLDDEATIRSNVGSLPPGIKVALTLVNRRASPFTSQSALWITGAVTPPITPHELWEPAAPDTKKPE